MMPLNMKIFTSQNYKTYQIHNVLLMTDLQKYHDDEDGVTDGEDAPEDAHRLGVPHELDKDDQ